VGSVVGAGGVPGRAVTPAGQDGGLVARGYVAGGRERAVPRGAAPPSSAGTARSWAVGRARMVDAILCAARAAGACSRIDLAAAPEALPGPPSVAMNPAAPIAVCARGGLWSACVTRAMGVACPRRPGPRRHRRRRIRIVGCDNEGDDGEDADADDVATHQLAGYLIFSAAAGRSGTMAGLRSRWPARDLFCGSDGSGR
jgi:hypothetical protein